MERFDANELPADIDYLTQKVSAPLANQSQNLKCKQSAIAELVAQNNQTTSIDKSHICTTSSPKRKSSKTSVQVLTTSVKDLKPYWNDLCVDINSRLLLPVETDSRDSGLSCLNTWSVSTVGKSWFSASLKVAQNQNLPPIFSQSFMSSLAEFRDSESTGQKSKKIRLYLSADQKALVRQWFGVSRFVFNQTVQILQDGSVKANWKAIKTGIMRDLPQWCDAVPYQIKSIAIKDACTAVKSAKQKYKKTGQIQRVRFRSRKNPSQSCYIPKSAISAKGIYHTKLGKITFAEALPGKIMDSRLSSYNGCFYISIPHQTAAAKTENQGRVVALDPGVRTFITFFSESTVGKIGESDFSRIHRLCFHLDDLISRISQTSGDRKRRMKKAAGRIRAKIKNLIDELHHKAARFLVDNFDVILLPTFETSQMVGKPHRKIRRKTVRSMLRFSHYRFKQFLKHKASEAGKTVVDVCEAYTSKTVSWTGELLKIGSAKKITSKVDGQTMDRDINGARGIFLRALVDTPWLRNQLAFVS